MKEFRNKNICILICILDRAQEGKNLYMYDHGCFLSFDTYSNIRCILDYILFLALDLPIFEMLSSYIYFVQHWYCRPDIVHSVILSHITIRERDPNKSTRPPVIIHGQRVMNMSSCDTPKLRSTTMEAKWWSRNNTNLRMIWQVWRMLGDSSCMKTISHFLPHSVYHS